MRRIERKIVRNDGDSKETGRRKEEDWKEAVRG